MADWIPRLRKGRHISSVKWIEVSWYLFTSKGIAFNLNLQQMAAQTTESFQSLRYQCEVTNFNEV